MGKKEPIQADNPQMHGHIRLCGTMDAYVDLGGMEGYIELCKKIGREGEARKRKAGGQGQSNNKQHYGRTSKGNAEQQAGRGAEPVH